jgi:hypothetical protein
VRLAIVTIALLAVAGTALAASSPREPKKVIVPAIQARAKAVNVKLADLPAASWTAKPPGPDSGSPRCSYYNPDQSDLTENGNANSPQFTLPSASYISSSTSIFKTAGQGRTAYARVVQPKLPKCLAELFKKGAGTKAQVTIVSAAERSFPKLADRSNVYRLVADFKLQNQKIRTIADFVVFNHGKVDTVIFFVGIGGAFKDSFEQAVAAKVASRAKAVG